MPLLELDFLSQSDLSTSATKRRDRGSPIPIPDEFEMFRTLHIETAIKTMKEAQEILQQEPHHATALQYVGWRYLCAQENLALAIKFLCLSTKSGNLIPQTLFLPRILMAGSDPGLMESWYLLGRAYMTIDEKVHGPGIRCDRIEASRFDTDCLGRVFKSYQRALSCNYRSGTLWNSVALLLYRVGRWEDCLYTFVCATRMDEEPLFWRNIDNSVSSIRDTLV